MPMLAPQPFPYQGSKRRIARHILPHIPPGTVTLYEPFCGSAAVSLAAAANGLASSYALSDLNPSLMRLWSAILNRPAELTAEYGRLWHEQLPDRKDYFFKIRARFNETHEPHDFLYLLARIVKGSVRYSADGKFNQSADNRRNGMHPAKMRRNIMATSALLAGRASVSAGDFRATLEQATAEDLIYMDPPYQGTSATRDHRYYSGLPFDDFVQALRLMNERELSYIVSYDGRTGTKRHGQYLPDDLDLERSDVFAGRSTQATLLGSTDSTIESLYISSALRNRLRETHPALMQPLSVARESVSA